MEKVVVTKMELIAMNSLVKGMYAEPGFSDMDITDINIRTGLPISVLRGVVASLIKKDLVCTSDLTYQGNYILYLTNKTEGLVEAWAEESDEPVELVLRD